MNLKAAFENTSKTPEVQKKEANEQTVEARKKIIQKAQEAARKQEQENSPQQNASFI